MPPLTSPRHATPPPRRHGLASIWLALLLAACAAPPRPVPVGITNPPAPLLVRPAAAPAPLAQASAPEPATTAPVGAPHAAPAPETPVAIEAESAAVAARFPDPPQHFDTPAFGAARSTFTSNAELQAVLRSLARDAGGSPTHVSLLSLGRSQAGVPLEALLFTRLADATPAAIAASGRPTVVLIGQQHGNEPAGCEALIVLARQLAQGPLEGLLERINVVILPRANPDGAQAERRSTASGIDVNRDHLLLRTPEAQAQAALVRDFRPVVVVDAHEFTVGGRFREKFGAVQRFDALLQYATTANLPDFVTRAAEEWFRRPVLGALKEAGLSVEWYHTTSTDLDDRRVSMGGTRPDTARNVHGLRNTVSLLIETRGVGLGRAHLARRVQTHVVAMGSVLRSAAARADDLVKLRSFVDADVSAQACQGEMVVDAAPTPSEYRLVMLDPDTGADKPLAVAWDSALALQVLKARARPCGYWLAPEQSTAVMHLRVLGIAVQRIDAKGVLRGETYRELSRRTGTRQDVRGSIADDASVTLVQVETVPTLIDVGPGSWYVPLDQPLANLAIAALEPDTQNSFLASGVIDAVAATARVLTRPDTRTSAVP